MCYHCRICKPERKQHQTWYSLRRGIESEYPPYPHPKRIELIYSLHVLSLLYLIKLLLVVVL